MTKKAHNPDSPHLSSDTIVEAVVDSFPFRLNSAGGAMKQPFYDALTASLHVGHGRCSVQDYLDMCKQSGLSAARYPGRTQEITVWPRDFVTYSLRRKWLRVIR